MKDKFLPTRQPNTLQSDKATQHFLRQPSSGFNAGSKQAETAEQCLALAKSQLAQGNIELAALTLEKAVTMDPTHHPSWAMLGQLMLEHGEVLSALECYASAATAAPDNAKYKEIVVELLRHTKFTKFNPQTKDLINQCLATPDLPCAKLLRPWLNILKSDPEFKKLYKISTRKGSGAVFNADVFDRAGDYSALLDDYFINGLYKLLVTDITFEQFLTHVRSFLLQQLDAKEPVFSPKDYTKLTAALAAYNYFNEYIFNYTQEEELAFTNLRKKIENDPSAAADTRAVALLGCYVPLHCLSNAQSLAETHRNDPLIGQMIQRQIDEFFSLRKTAEDIDTITEISDEVSKLVQEQYEELPYPKWHDFSKIMYEPSIEAPLQKIKARILNAGCGTGHEAIELGYAFPNAEVTAVDLSKNSLAFALQKAREHNIGNIRFHQADILNLGQLNTEFDYIASGGVLHHMADPEAGLKVLVSLLKPGGILRLGLYSKIARKAIIRIREVVSEKGISHSFDDIRYFRQHGRELVGSDIMDTMYKSADYYAMPTCRDLLFHIQEHQFTLLELKDILDRHGLEFIKFHHSIDVFQDYRKMFPDDKNANNLENWHKYEEKHPMTFARMYMFYCRKKEQAAQ